MARKRGWRVAYLASIGREGVIPTGGVTHDRRDHVTSLSGYGTGEVGMTGGHDHAEVSQKLGEETGENCTMRRISAWKAPLT